MAVKSYYAFRIDKTKAEFFEKELQAGRLRQGWGFEEGQHLLRLKVDKGARRNLPMLAVKKGDILIVPSIPSASQVTIVEATEDWREGYRFKRAAEYDDYGHIFPAKKLAVFERHASSVSGDIRKTLRTSSRFWSVSNYAEDIQRLLTKGAELDRVDNPQYRVTKSIENAYSQAFDSQLFRNRLIEEVNRSLQGSEWEFGLVAMLERLFPTFQVERTGGKLEKVHGTDILIRIPSLFSVETYGIAIQVKDHQGRVGDAGTDQVIMANYWEDNESIRIIDKIVLYTGAGKADNTEARDLPPGVRVMYAEDFGELLVRAGVAHISAKNMEGE
jgi:hypothetical protein